MPQADSTRTPLGPGGQILDQNLLKHIEQTPPLSSTDLLKIAGWSGMNTNGLANHLFRIAVRDHTLKTPAPTPPRGAATALIATTASPLDEWQDQLEDFINGKIDAEDSQEPTFPSIVRPVVVDIRWLPFSTSLSGYGVLVETTTSPSPSSNAVYVIGFSPDASSLTE